MIILVKGSTCNSQVLSLLCPFTCLLRAPPQMKPKLMSEVMQLLWTSPFSLHMVSYKSSNASHSSNFTCVLKQ